AELAAGGCAEGSNREQRIGGLPVGGVFAGAQHEPPSHCAEPFVEDRFVKQARHLLVSRNSAEIVAQVYNCSQPAPHSGKPQTIFQRMFTRGRITQASARGRFRRKTRPRADAWGYVEC